MQPQYERTVQRYEDRIKIDKDEMQRELKDRSQRLLEEKEAAEANNRERDTNADAVGRLRVSRLVEGGQSILMKI